MGNSDNSVKVQTYSWISSALGLNNSRSGELIWETKEGTTLAELLADLASSYPEFQKLVYDPDKGQLSNEVLVIVNNKLLQLKDFTKTEISSRDRITISPIIEGG